MKMWRSAVFFCAYWATTCDAFLSPSSTRYIAQTRTAQRQVPTSCDYRQRLPFLLKASDDGEQDQIDAEAPKTQGSKKKKSKKKIEPSDEDKQKSKEELMKAVGEKMREKKQQPQEEENLLDRFNPFKAGQNLRKTIDTALTSIASSKELKTKYYLDDRFLEEGGRMTERNPTLERLEQDDFVPEVLVVGATGEVGRLVVRRLLLEGRFRVRVLVRDLYTKTLNLLGPGVTYCQGDLNNMDSLEYAVTDVDKIVFCASAPRPDEEQFKEKFEDFMKETFDTREESVKSLENEIQQKEGSTLVSDMEWEQLSSVLDVRARLAEQIDCVGMQNLVRAYQHVRHADYGTSQTAKRSLFKFRDRQDDFNLFSLDESDDDVNAKAKDPFGGDSQQSFATYKDDEYDYDDEYEDYYDDGYDAASVEQRRDASVKVQTRWMRNQFGHGVFVGRVPKATSSGVGGEASIASTRLRSRENPENGIDLGIGFAGFIARLCSDGGVYEAFVRTGAYEDDGVEYVCEFSTSTKPTGSNKSRNKFVTVRLPFENFKPVRVKTGASSESEKSFPPFKGSDVRNIGFRYRSSRNDLKSKLEPGEWSSFYLALSFIKLYRTQPEPEFVYLSDARIPPVVRNGMVRHEAKQLVLSSAAEGLDSGAVKLFDEATMKIVLEDKMARSAEETYFKYRGEEILKNSGLSYSIVRVAGFNEAPGEASTIDVSPSNGNLLAVSRDDVAQVCVKALLDPNALNKSFYVSKKERATADEDISSKFSALPVDAVV